MGKIKMLLALLAISIALWQCRHEEVKEEPIPTADAPTPYPFQSPPFFPPMDIPSDNPLTYEGIELGRYLFWEKKLSGNNTQSCGSCHLPEHSFSDNNQFSVGITGAVGNRQSMALVNLGWAYNYFWDGRAVTLEIQVLEPVENPIEMNESWENALEELRNDPLYPPLYAAAFGTTEITKERTAKAMASFLRIMVSANSKFDLERRGEYTFTEAESAGFNLFLDEGGINPNTGEPFGGADCFHCHSHAGMQMGDYLFHNNGLDAHFHRDPGLAGVTGNPLDSGKFKTPTLRNIELTAPYMHDGRFTTLEEVLDHYNSGGVVSATIDPMMEAANEGLFLSDIQKQQVIAFLKCLTDTSFIHNPAFSDPHE
jgi:cytochrome c peroxidase